MNNVEYVALDQYLNEYPEDKTFDEIINILKNDNVDDEGVEPCEYFEDWYRPAIAQEIENLKWSIEHHITQVEKD